MRGDIGVYKGKATHRSWPQLPDELVRLIATFYLWDLAATSYCPRGWETRELWHSRMVYAALRDAVQIERFMLICPQWSLALETHPFWHQAVTLVDPLDALGHKAVVWPNPALTNNSSSLPAQPRRITPFRHFRFLTAASCLVCRINSPNTSQGLGVAKRTVSAPHLGAAGLCREHDRRKQAFCGLCLRDAPPYDTDAAGLVACMENEDEETWPHIDTTCRHCRGEGLWLRVCNEPRDREAVGGHKFNVSDYETRSSIEGFLDMAEGTITEVVNLANDRYWLRKHTKLPDMLNQAVAASRYDGREERFSRHESEDDLEMDLSEVDEEEEEDDTDFLQMTEDSGIRELALGDWARNRILDGYWISPADLWYGNTVPNRSIVVRAVHPCPWNREEEGDDDSEQEHPQKVTVRADIPPSFALCEQTYMAHQRQMRAVLLPALKNVVRRLVIECGADGVDPAMKAARMSLEDVIHELKDEAVWFDGVDWLERRGNLRREENERRIREEGSDDSSTSSKSDGSSTTSPVLSTTTLQTTPSPPPSDDKKESVRETDNRSVTIAVAPVLNPPRLLCSIPYVPVTVTHMPHYSFEAFRVVWREACAPLYHCRCRICERAMAKANETNGTTVPSKTQAQPNSPVKVAPIPLSDAPVVEIKLDEVTDLRRIAPHESDQLTLDEVDDVDGEGEDEVEYEEYELEEEEDEEEEDEEELLEVESPVDDNRSRSSWSEQTDRHHSPEGDNAAPHTPSRKRACDELDSEDVDGESAEDDELSVYIRTHAEGTPPKRLRRESPVKGEIIPESPGRMRKRSSEELDPTPGEVADYGSNKKRIKVTAAELDASDVQSPPTSLTAGESDHSSSQPPEDRLGHQPPGKIGVVNFDDLYVLQDE